MLSEVIRWTCNALIAAVLLRAAACRIFSRYPVFYSYLALVFSVSLYRFYIYRHYPGAVYGPVYWYTEFLSLAAGYCIIWEIYQLVLEGYSGAARLARRVVWFVFVVVLAKAISNGMSGQLLSASTVEEFARDLRLVQAFLLMGVVALLAYYAIPTGQNLKGILFGYSFFIGAHIVNLTLVDELSSPSPALYRYAPAVIYSVALLIWTPSLWSYQPKPIPQAEILIERDYEVLARRTARALSKARSLMTREVVP